MTKLSITFFENKLSSIGKKNEFTWSDFKAEFVHQVGPKDGVAFTAGTFAGNERKTIKASSRDLIILDVEQITSMETGEIYRQPPDVDKLAAILTAQNMAALIYTTHSHSPDAPRYRVIFPLDETIILNGDDEACVPLEYDREISLIVSRMIEIDDCVDTSKVGIASIFFAPRCPKENIQFAAVKIIDGNPLSSNDLIKKAGEIVKLNEAKQKKELETVAKIAVAKHEAKNSNEASFINRLKQHLPSLKDVLDSTGYTYHAKSDRWLSPHSKSGYPGVVKLECTDGVERVYIYHTSDPLCGSKEVFGVKAHDAIDIMIANQFGTSDNDFKHRLFQLAKQYGVTTNQDIFLNESATSHTANNGHHQDDSFDWPDPGPFIAKAQAAEYPIEALPISIRSSILEVCDFVKAPISMIASSALGAMSLAIQSQVDVKRAETLVGPTSLYILVIAESGERKSSCDKYFTAGIRRFEKEAIDTAKPKIIKFESDNEAWSTKVKAMRSQIQALVKDKKSTETEEAELEKLILEKPLKPKVPRYFYSDTTPEELAFNLSQVWPAGGVFSSEAGLVFGGHSMSKDAAMRTFAMYNVLWDGGKFQVDRRTSESFDQPPLSGPFVMLVH